MTGKIFFVSPGDPDLTPGQVTNWQNHLDQVAASHGGDWAIILLPSGSQVTEADGDDGGVTVLFPADLDATANS